MKQVHTQKFKDTHKYNDNYTAAMTTTQPHTDTRTLAQKKTHTHTEP